MYLYDAIIALAGAPRLADYDHPAMPDFVSNIPLVAPLLWHEAKDEVVPAWAAVPLAKPPLWEGRQALGTGETKSTLRGTRHALLTGGT